MSKEFDYNPHLDPRLVWTGKAEKNTLKVPLLPCIPYEIFSPRTILEYGWNSPHENETKSQKTTHSPLKKPIKTYETELNSADRPNRLILGDSLLVLNSLAHLEGLKGQVQMIYLDPPYGIGFNAKILTDTSKPEMNGTSDATEPNESEEKDAPEKDQVKAYRDNWNLGIHSYLTFLRDRLLLASILLHESGSIFVQIGIDNFHYVRIILDEIFGADNFVNIITFQKTGSTGGKNLPIVNDFIIWYAKSKPTMKYHQLFLKKDVGHDSIKTFSKVELTDGTRRNLTAEEKRNPRIIPEGGRLFKTISLHSQHHSKTRSYPFEYQGKTYPCPKDRQWSVSEAGLQVLAQKNRIYNEGKSILYIYYLDDFPLIPLSNLWIDARGDMKMRYNVQTAEKIIERCLLMTTDPGDLVIDPTCGSGTTAYVAEKWARRWITCDVSRMAINITRTRLLSALFDYFQMTFIQDTQNYTLFYKKYPHISASTIAYSKNPEYELMLDDPETDSSAIRVTNPFQLGMICVSQSQKKTPEKAITDNEKESSKKYIQNILQLLSQDGIWYPNGKNLSLIDITPTNSTYLQAQGKVRNCPTDRWFGIVIGPKYEIIDQEYLNHASGQARQSGLHQLLVFGYQFDENVQNHIRNSADSDIQYLMIGINPDITLEDLDSIPTNVQLFSVIGTPLIDVVEVKSMYQLTLRGIEIYQLDTNSKEILTLDHLSLWCIDESYNPSQFVVHQCFFPSKNRAAQSLLKNWQPWLDESTQDLLIGTKSRLFPRPKTGRIAIKTIDVRGYECMITINNKD